MAILKHIASKSSNYGAALEYLIFKHDELRKTPILDQNGNRIMRDEFYLDGLNCEPYSFDAACQQLNREYQKNKNKNEIKSHHYIISFDPRDSTENCLTGKRAQELGLEYAKANFPGHQALVCTHMDGHNGSGNIHVHIVINSLRKLDVPQQPFMERPIDCKAGYKHHVTNEYLKHLQKSLMDLCRCEFLHQVDLLSPSRMGVTEAEYWAQRRLDEKKQEIEKEGFTPNSTKFQTQKQLIRDAVAAA
jgi:putative rlx protein